MHVDINRARRRPRVADTLSALGKMRFEGLVIPQHRIGDVE